jgi:hypothetical protein
LSGFLWYKKLHKADILGAGSYRAKMGKALPPMGMVKIEGIDDLRI